MRFGFILRKCSNPKCERAFAGPARIKRCAGCRYEARARRQGPTPYREALTQGDPEMARAALRGELD